MENPDYTLFDPERWNACIKLLCRKLEELDTVQRPASLAFHYYGRVMNGGHSSHFDSHKDAHDDELLQALRDIGANEQARILAEARFLKRDINETIEDERDYASESIEDLDRRFYRLNPDIPELLARYFDAHRESFPK
ncbi:MAG: DUF4375 domain-containing protein [Chthoniobacteraceae bacterium]